MSEELKNLFGLLFSEVFENWVIYQNNYCELWVDAEEKKYQIFPNGLDDKIGYLMQDDIFDSTKLSDLWKIKGIINACCQEMSSVVEYMKRIYENWEYKNK